MVIFAPWMSETLTSFTKELILSIPQIITQN
jgi:flagellar biosynthesis protein FliQ